MPTSYGAWTPSGTVNQRMRLVIVYDTTTTTASVLVEGSVRVEAGYGFNDSNNSFSRSGFVGSASGSVSINVPSNGSQTLYTFSVTLARGTSLSTKSMAFSLTGIDYVGSSRTASVSASVTVAAKPAPATPTGVTVARSGSSLRVSWSGGAVHELQVRARSQNGSSTAAWAAWQTLSGSSFSSGGTYSVEMGYEWQARVRRVDSGVWSSYGASSNSAQLFDAPPTPTGVTLTRGSDSRHTVAWSASNPAAQPIVSFEIQRWTSARGAYVDAASGLADSSRSWVDTRSLPNEKLTWRVRAVNGAGASGWAHPPSFIFTTPAAPGLVRAVRSGSSDVLVTWAINARTAEYQTVQAQSSSDGGSTWSAWSSLSGHTSIPASATSRTITGLDGARLWRFRVVAGVTTPALSSASAASATVQVLTPPNAPTLLAPMSTQSTQSPVTFKWRHNAVDGSGQTAAELRYRIDGGAWVPLTATTVSQVTTAAPLPAGDVEWQARTRGAHATYSAWSAISTLEIAAPPATSILTPADGATYASNRLVLTTTYEDAQGAAMVGWTRRLRRPDGEIIEEVSGTGAWTVVTYKAVLADLTAYTAEWEVVSGTGLRSATATVHITTGFRPPVAPILTATWHEEAGVVDLAVTNGTGTPGVTEDTVSGRVERSDDGGLTWVTVADGLGIDPGLTDGWVALNSEPLYRAIAITALGVELASDAITLTTPSDRVWLVGEDGAAVCLSGDIELTPVMGSDRVLEHYYGDKRPTAHYGTARPVSVQVSASLLHGYGIDDPHEGLLGQDHWYRDYQRRAFWASLEAVSLPVSEPGVVGFSATVEAVEHVTV